MANGKPGDNPITDVVLWNFEVFGPETDALIREIAAFTTDYGVYDPFDDATKDILLAAADDRTKTPELQEALVVLVERLRRERHRPGAT